MGRKRGEGWLQRCPLSYDQARCFHSTFVKCYAIQAFLSHLIFTLSWCLKNNIRSRWEKFALSYNVASSKLPSWLQLGSRETPHASHPETKVKHCPQRNQRQAAQAAWVRFEPSTPRSDPRTGEFTCRSRRRAQPFLPSHSHKDNQARFEIQAEKWQRVPWKPPGERELEIIQEARTWCPIPMGADLLRLPAVPLSERDRSGAHQ